MKTSSKTTFCTIWDFGLDRNFQESSEKRLGGILAIGGPRSVLWVSEVPEGHGRSQTTLMDLILCSQAPDSGIFAVLLDTLFLGVSAKSNRTGSLFRFWMSPSRELRALCRLAQSISRF